MGAEPIAAARLDKVGAIHPALAAEVALNDARVLSWASASDYDLSCGRLRCRRGQFRDDEGSAARSRLRVAPPIRLVLGALPGRAALR